MNNHKVSKKIGFNVNNLGLMIGSSTEVETSDKEFAQNFADKSLIRDTGNWIASKIFGKQIEKNTIETLVKAEEKVKSVEKETGRFEIPMKIAIPIIENAGIEGLHPLSVGKSREAG